MLGLVSTNNKEYYKSSWEHIRDRLTCLDIRLSIEVKRQQDRVADPLERLRGLVVSNYELDHILNEVTAMNMDYAADVQRQLSELEQLEYTVEQKVKRSSEQLVELRLTSLSGKFKLSPLEEYIILICFAVEYDLRYEKLYAYIHNDITRKNATLYLIQKLLCSSDSEMLTVRQLLDPLKPLRQFFLHSIDDIPLNKHSLLTSQLKLDERIVDYLLGSETVDVQLSGIAELILPDETIQNKPILGDNLLNKLEAFLEQDRMEGNLIVNLYGPKGTGRKTLAKELCLRRNTPLLIADMGKMLSDWQEYKRLISSIMREAVLWRAVICMESSNPFCQEECNQEERLHFLAETLQKAPEVSLVFLLSNDKYDLRSDMKDFSFLALEVSPPKTNFAVELWKELSRGYSFSGDIDFYELSVNFKLTPGQMKGALAAARDEAEWVNPGSGLTMMLLQKACYREANQRLASVAQKVEASYSWEDIVLPEEQLQMLTDICNHAKFMGVVFEKWRFGEKIYRGKGMNVLFSGAPGTGKTMAAEVIAGALGTEIYKINLSQVVSKYIGETEKNLDRIFNVFHSSQAILFFDEADALFGKRSEVKDAHDRYANIETAYLLQKMEEYQGISILATNFAENIDQAFLRRINYHVKFPFPDALQRESIWRIIFPKEAPLDLSLDFGYVAQRIVVSGGNIRNIALSAAIKAASEGSEIRLQHILGAAKNEYLKAGKEWD